jgi:uncharacterized protein (DUF433 family)
MVCCVNLRERLSNLGPPLELAIAAPKWDNRDDLAPLSRPVGLKQPNHKLRPDEIDALVEAYQAGTSIEALSRDFDLYHQSVRAHLKPRGVTVRPQAVLSPTQVEEIVELYASGRSLRQLAAQYRSPPTASATTSSEQLSRCGRLVGCLVRGLIERT